MAMIEFQTLDGKKAKGYLAEPAPQRGRPTPAVVVVHEWWGLQDQIKSVCDQYAAQGIRALGVDLYHGETTKDPSRAGEMMAALDFAAAAKNIVGGAVRFLKEESPKVGVTGFCMGGAVTVLAAALVPEVDAAVSYYGLPDQKAYDIKAIKIPFAAHFANRDQWVTPSKAHHFAETLSALNEGAQCWFYEADHAFCNERRPEVYHAQNATIAWNRTLDFFKSHLA